MTNIHPSESFPKERYHLSMEKQGRDEKRAKYRWIFLCLLMVFGFAIFGFANERVIGQDERTLVTTPEAFPFNCVVKLFVLREVCDKLSGSITTEYPKGTGILINEDTVLTVAHLVAPQNNLLNTKVVTQIIIVPSFDSLKFANELNSGKKKEIHHFIRAGNFLINDLQDFPFGFAYSASFFYDPEYGEGSHDFAIIKLDRPIFMPEYPSLMWRDETWWKEEPRMLEAVGYPGNLSNGRLMYTHSAPTANIGFAGVKTSVLINEGYRIEHQCDTSEGQSGGPVFYGEDVIGLIEGQIKILPKAYAMALNNYADTIADQMATIMPDSKPDLVLRDLAVTNGGEANAVTIGVTEGIGYALKMLNIGTEAAEGFYITFLLTPNIYNIRNYLSQAGRTGEIELGHVQYGSLESYFTSKAEGVLTGTIEIPENVRGQIDYDEDYYLAAVLNYHNPIDEFAGTDELWGAANFDNYHVFGKALRLTPPEAAASTVEVKVVTSASGKAFGIGINGETKTTPAALRVEKGASVHLVLTTPQYKDETGIIDGEDARYSLKWSDSGPLDRTATITATKTFTIDNHATEYKIQTGVIGVNASQANISWPSAWVGKNTWQSFTANSDTVVVSGKEYQFKKWLVYKTGQELEYTNASLSLQIDGPVKVEALFEPVDQIENPNTYLTVTIGTGIFNISETPPPFTLYKATNGVNSNASDIDAEVKRRIDRGETLCLGTYEGYPHKTLKLEKKSDGTNVVYFLYTPERLAEGIQRSNAGVTLNGDGGMGHWGSYHILYTGNGSYNNVTSIANGDVVISWFEEAKEYYVTFNTYPSGIGSLSKSDGWYETLDQFGNSDEVSVSANDVEDWKFDHWEVNGVSYFKGYDDGNISVASTGRLYIEVVYQPSNVIAVYRYAPTYSLLFRRGVKNPEKYKNITFPANFTFHVEDIQKAGPYTHTVDENANVTLKIAEQAEMKLTSLFTGNDTRLTIDYLYLLKGGAYQFPGYIQTRNESGSHISQLFNIVSDGEYHFIYRPEFAFEQTTVPTGLTAYDGYAKLQYPKGYYTWGEGGIEIEVPFYAENETSGQRYRFQRSEVKDTGGTREVYETTYMASPSTSPVKTVVYYEPVFPLSVTAVPYINQELALYQGSTLAGSVETPCSTVLEAGNWTLRGDKVLEMDIVEFIGGNDCRLTYAYCENGEAFSVTSGEETFEMTWTPQAGDGKSYGQQIHYTEHYKVEETDNLTEEATGRWYESGETVTVTAVEPDGYVFDSWQIVTPEGTYVVTEKALEFPANQPCKLEAIYVTNVRGGLKIQYPHTVHANRFASRQFPIWLNLAGLTNMKEFCMTLSHDTLRFVSFTKADNLPIETAYAIEE